MATIFELIEAGDAEGARALAGTDPSVARQRNESGVSALLLAKYYGRAEIVEVLLAVASGLDVFEASAYGRVDRLRELLDSDPAAVNRFADDGFTALQLASFFAQPAAVRLLLECGAGVDLVSRNPMRLRALHSASAARQTEIARLLLDHGADPDAAQEGGFTPLHAAAQNGDEELTRLLLARGAAKAPENDTGATPADLAREAGHEALVSLLLREVDSGALG